MSKRFLDTELWNKEWYQDLTILEKITFKFILENCDCAGVWNTNFKLASFLIGANINMDIIDAINRHKKQFEILANGNIFVIDFIKFQYGTLSENCKPHKPIIEKLKNYGLYERVSKGYSKGIQTLEEKEKEKEKEEEKEKEQKQVKDNYISFQKTDYLTNPLIDKCFEIYQKECPNLLRLSFERRNAKTREELNDFLNEIDSDIGYFEELCKKANDLKQIVNKRIDFKMLIKNHIGIYNGKYIDENQGLTQADIKELFKSG